MVITLSGTSYHWGIGPEVSGMLAEIGIVQTPRRRKVGKGEQYIYSDITPEQASEVAEMLENLAYLRRSNSNGPEDTNEARAFERDARRIRDSEET